MQDHKKRIQLLKYLFEIAHTKLFVIGKLTFKITRMKVFLYYKQNKETFRSVELDYNFDKIGEVENDGYKKLKNMIENFVLDCFYYHEFDGKPMNLKDMCELLGIEQSGLTNRIGRIVEKITTELNKKHPEMKIKSLKTFKNIIELLIIDG